MVMTYTKTSLITSSGVNGPIFSQISIFKRELSLSFENKQKSEAKVNVFIKADAKKT